MNGYVLKTYRMVWKTMDRFANTEHAVIDAGDAVYDVVRSVHETG
jgi:hypothetical protein